MHYDREWSDAEGLPSLRRGEWIETRLRTTWRSVTPAVSPRFGGGSGLKLLALALSRFWFCRLPSLRRGEWIETDGMAGAIADLAKKSPLASAGGVD